MRLVAFLIALAMFCPSAAFALKAQKGGLVHSTTTVTGSVDIGTMILDQPTRGLSDYVKNYVDVARGGVDWRVFGKTKEITVEGKTKDGFDYGYVRPEFTKEVKELDGKEVKIKGFMFPLDAADNQKLFLFGPFPLSCPFHYHVAPSLVVEVHADRSPIAFSYDPVTIAGKLQLVGKDPENSTFYRLLDARKVKDDGK